MRKMPEYRLNLVRELRQRSTESEDHLWFYLRARRMDGLKFRRQRPIGRYIADFCCDEVKLVIEIDGIYHSEADQAEYDEIRDQALSAQGYSILRIAPDESLNQTDLVLTKIRSIILNGSPLPLWERGQG